MSFEWWSLAGLGGLVAFATFVWKMIDAIRDRPRLAIGRIDERQWVWEDWGHEGVRFVCIHVTNQGRRVALRCLARAHVTSQSDRSKSRNVVLHWSGTPFEADTPIDLAVGEERRLDVAFATERQPREGLRMATARALARDPGEEILPPGYYEMEISVTCDGGRSRGARLRVYSPNTWRDLHATA